MLISNRTFYLVIISVVVILGAVLGYAYFNITKLASDITSYTTVESTEDAQIEALKKQSDSDQAPDIEKDLDSTTLDKIDEELPQIDTLAKEL